MDFNYKKYSLEQLENWMHDALSTNEASPHEIYSTIRKVVKYQYDYHQEQSKRCLGLLDLLSGNRPVNLDNMSRSSHYDDMISSGYEMTADGFWIKESDDTLHIRQYTLSVLDMNHFKNYTHKITAKDLMAAHCFISIFNDGRYDSIFCLDGHPEVIAKILRKQYNTREKTFSLIQYGDVIKLGKSVEQTKFYDNDYGFNRTFDILDDMIECYRQCSCQYGYIFTGNEWVSYRIHKEGFSTANLELLTNA